MAIPNANANTQANASVNASANASVRGRARGRGPGPGLRGEEGFFVDSKWIRLGKNNFFGRAINPKRK
jgi:hypothetical protein